jgi:hypothetical protein
LTLALVAGQLPKSAGKDAPDKRADKNPGDNTGRVIAEGVGTTADDALKDAFRAAVRQTVGTMVDAETLVKNDTVISDKVLTYSDGIVSSYDVVKSEKRDGLWRVTISARVERRAVAERLRKAIRSIDGKDLAAEVSTRKDAREGAAGLLQSVLKEAPDLLVAEAKRTTAKDYDDDTQTLSVEVRVKVDKNKYADYFRRLVQVLGKVSLAKDAVSLNAIGPGRVGSVVRWEIANTNVFATPALDRFPKGWVFWTVGNMDDQAVRPRWNWYVIDADFNKVVEPLRGSLACRIVARDARGEAVGEVDVNLDNGPGDSSSWLGQILQRPRGVTATADRVSLRPRSVTATADHVRYYRSLFGEAKNAADGMVTEDSSFALLFAPLALDASSALESSHAGRYRLAYWPSLWYRTKLSLTEKQLRQVKEISCKVIFKPAADSLDR